MTELHAPGGPKVIYCYVPFLLVAINRCERLDVEGHFRGRQLGD